MHWRLPLTLLLGLAASACAIALWITEQLTDSFTFELLTIPAKLLLLTAFPLFLGNLSSFLHRRPVVAFSFFVAGSVSPF
jgi:hypothetical protein